MQKCDLCQATTSQELYTISRFERPFPIHRCNNCGLIFMKPFFSDTEIEAFYSEEYFVGSTQKKAFTYTDERKNKKGYAAVNNKRVQKLKKALPKTMQAHPSFLDVGCSFGGLMRAAEKEGFSAAGIDISNYAIEKDLAEGLNVQKGSPETAKLPNEEYDAITMVEVIEHLKNPTKAISNLFHALKPGGILLIQTANMDGRQARKAGADYHYFLPGHLHYFSRTTISKLLAQTGFSRLKFFYPCEFGLLPKLRKSRGDFTKLRDYLRWLKTAIYHFKSKIHAGNYALTSGMVVYAHKPIN